MRKVRAADAKAHFARLLADVERGETIVITRHGRTIARLVPEASPRQADIRKVKKQIAALRKTMPRLSASDILSARHEGHEY
ncbi:MAG: type II toxin-antitoxin system prevent-host-death family antitoxin [Enhydrobacter sp.]|nr:type II toxin-antitoxin system prevent-host-death family antitoxin [Enhydrobacter sp.]